MGREVRILCVCATGIAQSTMIEMGLKEYCKKKEIPAVFCKCQYLQAPTQCELFGADFVFEATTFNVQYPANVRRFQGLPFLTGVGVDTVLEEFQKALDALVEAEG